MPERLYFMFALWRRAFICKNKIILEDIGHKFLLVSTKVDNLDLDGVSLCLCGQKYFLHLVRDFCIPFHQTYRKFKCKKVIILLLSGLHGIRFSTVVSKHLKLKEYCVTTEISKWRPRTKKKRI